MSSRNTAFSAHLIESQSTESAITNWMWLIEQVKGIFENNKNNKINKYKVKIKE